MGLLQLFFGSTSSDKIQAIVSKQNKEFPSPEDERQTQSCDVSRDHTPAQRCRRRGSDPAVVPSESEEVVESLTERFYSSDAAPNGSPASHRRKDAAELSLDNFFPEFSEARRYTILEMIGKGSYGVVCAALDNQTGKRVAIKKVKNVFDNDADATRVLREIKLLRLLQHPGIVKILHIMLPPNHRDFREIFIVFELMESDLHNVIQANDISVLAQHQKHILYQLLCALKHIHSAAVFHRDLKPKNILINSNGSIRICDFGLARLCVDVAQTVFWTDYVATRWYRAPELCGSFFTKYTPAIDIWSIGCIFAELTEGRPLFPGHHVLHQLKLITSLLGTPSPETISKVRNDKARRFLSSLPPRPPVPFGSYFKNCDARLLDLLSRILQFDPSKRPTVEEALQDPVFDGIRRGSYEAAAMPISKLAFDFENRKLRKSDIKELIYEEILNYHPSVKEAWLEGNPGTLNYPSAIDRFKKKFDALEDSVLDVPEVEYSTSVPKENSNFMSHRARSKNPLQSKSRSIFGQSFS